MSTDSATGRNETPAARTVAPTVLDVGPADPTSLAAEVP